MPKDEEAGGSFALAKTGEGAPADAVSEAAAELARVSQEAAALAGEHAAASTALSVRGGQDAALAKARMAEMRSMVARKQGEMKAAQEKLETELARRVEAAREIMRPLEKMMEKLGEGIWTVNLYLGRDEEIVQLADGKPAPKDEPISVRQTVLSMDEECAVAAERGGIDVTEMEKFDGWLLESRAHVEQVIPEKKGVVAIVPRAGTGKDYGNPWANAAIGQANKTTYFLIRNGEKLYRTMTDYRAEGNLVPRADEFTGFFTYKRFDWETHEYVPEPIRPGSDEWLEAEERADARKRHFMRAALILQGLIDRTAAFHPLPAPNLSFLDPRSHEQGLVRFVYDGERTLGDGREPFRDWQRRLLSELTPGMRIVGAFDSVEWLSANRASSDWGSSRRVTPKNASDPKPGVPYAVEARGDGGMAFLYGREDEIWDGRSWEPRKPSKRASCKVYVTDSFILPFDLATVEEMEGYLSDRANRHEYARMFPLLKSAIAAKKAEAAEEAPFRLMLAGLISTRDGVSLADATEAVPALVDWWKFTNKQHRPLVGVEEAKAVRGIVAEHKRRLAQENGKPGNEVVDKLKALHPAAMAIARKRDGKLVAASPSAPGEKDWLRLDYYSAKGEWKSTEDWVLPAKAAMGRWLILWESPAWGKRDGKANPGNSLTAPEKAKAVETVRAAYAARGKDGVLFAVAYDACGREFRAFTATAPRVNPGRLLTERPIRPEIKSPAWQWRRDKDGSVRISGTTREYVTEYCSPFPSSSGEEKDVKPWEAKGQEPLWEKEGAWDEALTWKREYEAAREKEWALERKRDATLKAVEEGWLANEEEKAKARFTEDYGDESLWEGHRKTLKLQYPHRHTSLLRAVSLLIESGVDVSAMTAGEAVEAAKELDGGVPREAVPGLVPIQDVEGVGAVEGSPPRQSEGDGLPEGVRDLPLTLPRGKNPG